MRKTAFWLMILLATLYLATGFVLAQESATILVNRDGVNVRLLPAIGAEVIGNVQAGWRAPATGRSPDNQWIRIDFNGEEGWIGFPVINLFGDMNALPVADPRTIPYGGFESPRSGLTSASSPISGKLWESGIRVRGGPSQAYPVLANAPRYTIFPLLGRTINNAWLQVNFEGTLGWVATRYVEIQNGASIISLPVDGVVADTLPISEGTREDYEATLRFLLDRVNLAQPSLDGIRAVWTTIALGQLSACGGYPARPTDYNIPNPLLAAFYPTLNPLQEFFNAAMSNVRLAIDLWIDVCSRPQPDRGVVGQATVQGALEAINAADGQFTELRRRINELLPPAGGVGADECLFTFSNASDILKIIPFGQIVRGTIDAGQPVVGFCFDAAAGTNLRFEFLQVSGNISALLSVSAFDNPTNFIANGRAAGAATLTVGPVLIPTTGRYLLIISDLSTPSPQSDFAIVVSNITGLTVTGPSLVLDPATGQPVIAPSTFGGLTPIPGLTPTAAEAVTCPSLAFNCTELLSCDQAIACLSAGNFTLDPNGDGIPCDNLCTGGQ
jgi:uncharacterized protein YraI